MNDLTKDYLAMILVVVGIGLMYYIGRLLIAVVTYFVGLVG